jgi:hypothetical protein
MRSILKKSLTFISRRGRGFMKDFFSLVSGPKQFLSQVTDCNQDNIVRAISFLIIIICLCNGMTFLFKRDVSLNTLVLMAISVPHIALWMMAQFLLLMMSWIIVFARVAMRDIMLAYIYLTSIAILLQSVYFCFIYNAMRITERTNPDLFDIITKYDERNVRDWAALFQDNSELFSFGLSMGAVTLTYVAADLLWTIVVWGKFRSEARTGKTRSFLAFLIFYGSSVFLYLASLELWNMLSFALGIDT